MTETPDERPRPTPRARPGAAARPSPRPRVAGSRRDRDEPTDVVPTAVSAAGPRPSARKGAAAAGAERRPRSTRGGSSATASSAPRAGRRVTTLALVLALLCLAAAAGAGFLLWQRLNPSSVDTSVLAATRDSVQALYAYDYRDSDGSVDGKLAVLTGDLREQYETDLSQGGILDTYEQVSATTNYEVAEVGLRRINEAQDTASLVVFGRYVVKSATTGEQPAPQGSGCEVSADGGQACTQTIDVDVVKIDGTWKISELAVRTSS